MPNAILIKPDQKSIEEKAIAGGMKKCPFCAEIIKDEAVKCRYCHEWLGDKEQSESTESSLISVNEESEYIKNLREHFSSMSIDQLAVFKETYNEDEYTPEARVVINDEFDLL